MKFKAFQNSRFIIISLILAGIAYWTRINGVWVFIVISLIYFLTYKKSWKFFTNYGIAIAAFLLIISPLSVTLFLRPLGGIQLFLALLLYM